MLDIASRVCRGAGWWEEDAETASFRVAGGERSFGGAEENCGDGRVIDSGVVTGGDVTLAGVWSSSSEW